MNAAETRTMYFPEIQRVLSLNLRRGRGVSGRVGDSLHVPLDGKD